MFNFRKKSIIIGLLSISFIPIVLTSCNSKAYSIENELLELEIQKNTLLKVEEFLDTGTINLLDVASDNQQLSNIFIIPDAQAIFKEGKEYRVWYSWDFSKKNIVSFENNGNIVFNININVGLSNSNNYITKEKKFLILIEDAMFIEKDPNTGLTPNIPNTKGSRYFYNDIKFKIIRKDVFDKSVIFNVDFFSPNSLINNRPIIIKHGASDETAMDANASNDFIESPSRVTFDNVKYRFIIESADFDELNPRKGIYKIRVTPETDDIFNYDVIEYAKNLGISFDKIYYYYEKNVNFKYPSDNNIITHNTTNLKIATSISDVISGSVEAFNPTIKNISLIIGKNAKEIVEINNKTLGGIFLPPIFKHQYSIEPFKKVIFSIKSVITNENDLENLFFEIEVSVGNNSRFVISEIGDKKISINYFFK